MNKYSGERKKSTTLLNRDELNEMLANASDETLVSGKVTVGEIRARIRERSVAVRKENEAFNEKVLAEFAQRQAKRASERDAAVAAALDRARYEFERLGIPYPASSPEIHKIREEVGKLRPALDAAVTTEEFTHIDQRARELASRYVKASAKRKTGAKAEAE